MPVEFLSDEQAARYRWYYVAPGPEQIARFFYLRFADLAFVAQRRRPCNRLGCVVQLCTLRFLVTFPPDPLDLPTVVVDTLPAQLGAAPPEIEEHRKRISLSLIHI